MRHIKAALPHITLVLGLMTLTFFVIDRVNTGMAFMTSELSKWVFAALALFAIATSVLLIISQYREEARAMRRRQRAHKPVPPTRGHADFDEDTMQEPTK